MTVTTTSLQVPSVLREDLSARQQPWGKQTNALLGGSTTLELNDAISVTLAFKPLVLTVFVHGKPAIEFNAQQMFTMEHRREKQVILSVLPASRTATAALFRGMQQFSSNAMTLPWPLSSLLAWLSNTNPDCI